MPHPSRSRAGSRAHQWMMQRRARQSSAGSQIANQFHRHHAPNGGVGVGPGAHSTVQHPGVASQRMPQATPYGAAPAAAQYPGAHAASPHLGLGDLAEGLTHHGHGAAHPQQVAPLAGACRCVHLCMRACVNVFVGMPIGRALARACACGRHGCCVAVASECPTKRIRLRAAAGSGAFPRRVASPGARRPGGGPDPPRPRRCASAAGRPPCRRLSLRACVFVFCAYAYWACACARVRMRTSRVPRGGGE